MSVPGYGYSSRFVRFARFAGFSALVFGLVIAAFALWFNRTFSAELRQVLHHRPPVVTLLSDTGSILAKKGPRDRYISLDRLPQSLIDAVISTEDRRFFSHFGIDPQGLARAIWSNLARGRLREGGSTLTQQLVKNVFLTRKRTLTRKFRELVISFWLETHYSKEQILEAYLNRVYFGAGGSHGIESAAWYYFDRSAADLDLSQSALLAGLLKAPSYYSPRKNLARSHKRAAIVLDNMVAAGTLSPARAEQARTRPAQLVKNRRKKRITGSEYALDWIMERVRQTVGRIETDLVVTTTLNPDWQAAAQKRLAAMVERNRREKKIDQAAAILLDERGGIKLMVGGRSYEESQFNRVTMARRQPGSSFKPIVYLAAMEQGRTPDSIVLDERVNIEDWHPRNYARFHRGPVTLRKALASSINSVAARLAAEMGPDTIIATARRLGIRSPLSRRPSLALGSSEVTPLEMTGAYVPFMNGGFQATPHIITRIETGRGEVLFERETTPPRRIIDPAFVYDMNDMLGAVVQSGTGRKARLDTHQVAGKTGTSTDYRDAWFIGYSGHFTAGIWIGNDNNAPTREVSGSGLPVRLWKQIMEMAHKNRPPRSLPGYGTQTETGPKTVILREQLPLDDIIVTSSENGTENALSVLVNNDSDR